MSQRLDHPAGVDADRAGQCAQTICRTGFLTTVDESIAQLGQAMRLFAACLQSADLPPNHNALPCGKRQVISHAIDLTKTALDAFVDQIMSLGQRFQIFQMHLRIVIENDAGIKQVMRIENVFNFLHKRQSFLSPFQLHKGRHVAAGAVFSL